MAATLLTIISLQFQPHLGGNVEKLVGVVWFSSSSSDSGGLRIVIELHRRFILLLRLRDGSGLLDPFGDFPSTSNNVRLALGGAVAAARRQHGLEVEDGGHLKEFVVIFVFCWGALYCSIFLLMTGRNGSSGAPSTRSGG